mmetsp:Transcript_15471/g.32716  ORF Transcript_15471/g.32716 Transcript_15471/m.32716 type:complete len:209 (-) Transcript_15471:328-954(-)
MTPLQTFQERSKQVQHVVHELQLVVDPPSGRHEVQRLVVPQAQMHSDHETIAKVVLFHEANRVLLPRETPPQHLEQLQFRIQLLQPRRMLPLVHVGGQRHPMPLVIVRSVIPVDVVRYPEGLVYVPRPVRFQSQLLGAGHVDVIASEEEGEYVVDAAAVVPLEFQPRDVERLGEVPRAADLAEAVAQSEFRDVYDLVGEPEFECRIRL